MTCKASQHRQQTRVYREIATRIAEALRAALPGHHTVDVLPAAEVGDADSYDALVLGSAAMRVADGDFRDWDAIDAWGTRIAAERSRATAR